MKKNNKERLFEMMYKVAGLSINENTSIMPPSTPPGFDSENFMSLDDFLMKNQKTINEIEIDDYEKKDISVLDVLQQRHKEKKENIPLTRDRKLPFLFGKFVEGIVDENGVEYDLEKLKNEITKHPINLLSQPEKVGKINAWSVSLPATLGLIFNKNANKFEIAITCPKAGKCKQDCFAWKANYIRVERTSLHRLKMLNYVVNHWELFEKRLISEIENKQIINDEKNIKTIIRWHDSGDFFSDAYLKGALDIARKTPKVDHYAYTKSISMVSGVDIPQNFFIRFSFGGLEDKMIDIEKAPYAAILYPEEFKKYIQKKRKTDDAEGGWFFQYENASNDLKNYVANKYNFDPKNVLYVSELEKIKYDENAPKKWLVIVIPGDSDIAGYRRDVLGTILLKH